MIRLGPRKAYPSTHRGSMGRAREVKGARVPESRPPLSADDLFTQSKTVGRENWFI